MESSQYIFVVSGVVQCVGFRYHTSRQAQTLGLFGYAKNLNDGRVEVLAVGESQQIEKLHAWLNIGPSSATVDNVVMRQIKESEQQNIRVGEFKIL
ncbi:acylphosphatase [Vibrio sp. 10N.261.46.E12]|uniref:acylphosphatase n=1 Tax=unclassified Vibrio TaxID=2614977 RepID=UPI00097801D6|nr:MULTISPECIES: acylphosphatase [unclassified Vibrio]OMO36720.1 acylphosphatase [Vibrio sp. 10N.261.45.E1]PMJ25711.1 acylphosphatase [Vibrio sp. 10N.286.45.B6]PML91414.1 acylphosphatase [Vibrio sp. 10N.261.49.E11]PMM65555.1 acylphosphatase [Vibrio sp. 10N.261.46.F12]PMM83399.1 acylphosphatase [Vibrio sp. 10N.261.46.E8]